ncbi:MAG: NAD kinase [Betaproteobacteria bacterium]|nr:NAD kinase [Betaproteobacteria bacterium]
MAFQIVALIGKYKSPEIAGPVLELWQFLESRGFRVLLDRLTAAQVPDKSGAALTLDEIGRQADLAIVLGGDGTMLNIARTLAPHNVPLVGVNQGRLGFLTDVSLNTMQQTLGAILDGQYVAEQRMLLEGQVTSRGNPVFSSLAFNDVVVHRGVKGSMIEFEVRIDDQYVYTQRSDGLIVATPTGSTAYALSSGGPILHPGLTMMALVPVCPHTLSNRPIVISGDSRVEVLMHSNPDARVHFDSHSYFDLQADDRVEVRRCPHTVSLLHPVGHNYYAMLREKLGWSEFPASAS